LHEALTRPIELDGVERFVGASIGAALHPLHATTAEELLRNADAAMYDVKRNRTSPRLYEPGTAEGVGELELAAELLNGLDRGEIVLHFQPELDLHTGAIVAVEALARWDHPSRGLLPPLEFIPLAERTGLIRPLTVATITQALDQVLAWRRNGHSPRISVNLSAGVLTDQALAQEILAALDHRELPGEVLSVEVTESAVIGDRDSAISFLTTLRAAGIRVELDDFGSGYASFGYLRDLPLDAVKLDRSLVATVLDRADSREILRCTAEVIHGLGYQIIGEGIEVPAQAALLRAVGCDIGQGFLFSRPVPAHDLDVTGGSPLSVTQSG
jgi:EAL domain-containing protein (putative c-di-GMP-specific phosphodiesterase class I)